MGTVITVYADGKKHKHDMFRSRKARDAAVKWLRGEGWTVKCYASNFEGVTYFCYEAEK